MSSSVTFGIHFNPRDSKFLLSTVQAESDTVTITDVDEYK